MISRCFREKSASDINRRRAALERGVTDTAEKVSGIRRTATIAQTDGSNISRTRGRDAHIVIDARYECSIRIIIII